MRLVRSLCVIATAVTMLSFALGAGAESKESPSSGVLSYEQSGNWIYWNGPDVLTDGEVLEYKGTKREDGSCTYAWTDRNVGAPPGHFALWTETAHNAKECILRAARTILPLDRLSDFDDEDGDAHVQQSLKPMESIVSDAEANDSQSFRLLASKTVWLKTVYEDPVQIDVNSVRVEVSFEYNGSCVTDSWGHDANWYYFTGTGWYLASSGGQAAQNCSYAATEADGYFETYAWGDDSELTWTNHRNITVYGEEDGSQTNSYNLTKGGEDSGLLHTQILHS